MPPLLPTAFLDLFSGPEMLLVFFVVLIFFGGKRMPEFARGFGKAVRELRKAAGEVEHEFKRVMEDAERTSGVTEISASLSSIPRVDLEPSPPKPAPPPAAPPPLPPPVRTQQPPPADPDYRIDV